MQNRIALSVLLTSVFALTACGEGEPETNVATDPATNPGDGTSERDRSRGDGSQDPIQDPPPVVDNPTSPPPSTNVCMESVGSGINGRELFGIAEYSELSPQGSNATTVRFDPGEISYNDPSMSSNSRTGSLRASLWASPRPYSGAAQEGYVITQYKIEFSNGVRYLLNGQSSNLSVRTLNALTPPAGNYCMVVTLEEYAPGECNTADDYCIIDWANFGSEVRFQ